PLAPRLGPEAGGNRVERIGEFAPRRTRIGTDLGEGAGRPVPAGARRLRRLDLVRAHPFEEVIFGIVFADMLEAQPAPAPRPVEVGRRQGSAEFSRLPAATNRTADLRALNPSMPFRLPCRHIFLAIGTHLY